MEFIKWVAWGFKEPKPDLVPEDKDITFFGMFTFNEREYEELPYVIKSSLEKEDGVYKYKLVFHGEKSLFNYNCMNIFNQILLLENKEK